MEVRIHTAMGILLEKMATITTADTEVGTLMLMGIEMGMSESQELKKIDEDSNQAEMEKKLNLTAGLQVLL